MRIGWLRATSFCKKLLFQPFYEKVRIKIHLYTLAVKKTIYKKAFRREFGAFSNI